MRMPVVPQLSTKNGTSNQNARLTNVLRESSKAGDKAVIRPGLNDVLDYAGVGAGLIPFHGALLSVFDNTIYADSSAPAFGSMTSPDVAFNLASIDWNSGTTYQIGNSAWYNGVLWTSIALDNLNHAPAAGSTYWQTSFPPTWNSGYTYGDGDLVYSAGYVWESSASANVGNTPQSGAWWASVWTVIDGLAPWDEDTTYDVDDIVSYGGLLYRAIVAGKGGNPGSGGSIAPPADQYTRRYSNTPYSGGSGFYELATECVVLYQPLINGRACVAQPEGAITVYYDNNTLTTPQWGVI